MEEKKKEDEIRREPIVDGFRVNGKMTGDMKKIRGLLSTLRFLSIVQEGDYLVAINVESRDIQKNPYSFSILYLHPDYAELMYTSAPGTSPKKRRIDMLRYFLDIATLAAPAYEFESGQVYQLIEAALKEITEYAQSSYDEIFAKYDSIKTEYELLHKKLRQTKLSNENLARENIELKSRNDDFTLKVRGLETYSDDVLTLKVQEWLSEHNSEINVTEFSRVHKVPEIRVEQMLNKLVVDGVLEVRG
ncbi:MAG: hypothetical protein NT157_06370 [Candidatus Micrarchaeota archaeon]|nr:hypothetical protein [Candidatus Micrarchaeota archaeon]